MRNHLIRLFLIIILALPAQGARVNFSLDNKGQESISFPDGPARPSYDSNQQKYFQSFHDVSVQILAISADTVRIVFTRPLLVKLEEAGREYSVEVARIDFKMEPSKVQALIKLDSNQHQMVFRKTSADVTTQNILAASHAEGGIESLARGSYVDRFWAHTGEFQLPYLSIGEILSGQPVAKDILVTFSEVEGYDPHAQKLVLERTKTTVAIDSAFDKTKFSNYPIHDSASIELMNTIERVNEFRRNEFGRIMSYTDAQGRQMIAITRPDDRPEEERRVSSEVQCRELLRKIGVR